MGLLLVLSSEVLVGAVWKLKKRFQCSSQLFWFIGHFPNVRWQLVPMAAPGAKLPYTIALFIYADYV